MYVLEKTLSVRLMWPLVRLSGSDPRSTLEAACIPLRDLADPETRAPEGILPQLLSALIARRGDARVGLEGGASYQHGDLEALEELMATASSLRDAISCMTRYQRLLHDGLQVELLEDGPLAVFRLLLQGSALTPAVNDYLLALVLSFARAHTQMPEPVVEVQVAHARTVYEAEYGRIFGGPVRFNMPHNALVFHRSYLEVPMQNANPALHASCELLAQAKLARHTSRAGVTGKVRDLVTLQLRSGDTRMSTVADNLAMSVATLRRRLDHEGTSHTEILDELRYELAQTYLRDPRLAISEVAFMLGFAHVAAFYKAFRRWTGGATPASFRAQAITQTFPIIPDDRDSSRSRSA